ncbi:MAG: ComF family protein [Desulfuromonadales bacterium]|nr:ComF family protein [Desulfuromonadales bacterium]
MKSFYCALLDFIFPPLCHVCRKYIPQAGKLHICSSCRELMPVPSHPLCTVCGAPFAGAGDDHPCSSCLRDPPAFNAARAALIHDGPGRSLIHAFKYNAKTYLRRPLALLTVENLADFVVPRCPDLIAPVPLHVKRLRSRGFNQALLVGELLAREWRIPLHRQAMKRVRWTEPQINLAAELRRGNVKGAFSVPDASLVAGKRVLLVDDVFTTGSTVAECSKVLKRAGAAEILVVTVTRALN